MTAANRTTKGPGSRRGTWGVQTHLYAFTVLKKHLVGTNSQHFEGRFETVSPPLNMALEVLKAHPAGSGVEPQPQTYFDTFKVLKMHLMATDSQHFRVV